MLYTMFTKVVNITLCATNFIYTFIVLCNFTNFLSNHNESQKSMLHTKGGESLVVSTIWSLLINASLLSLFMVQHSLMASDTVKNLYRQFNIPEVERSIYNVGTAIVIHLLMSNWRSVPWATVWNIDTFNNEKLWLLFTGIHVFGWFIIYSGCIMMDISELAGLKQVYYKVSGRQEPIKMKCEKLQRLYSHMRHPSFTGFLIILWVHPFMSIDRCLLAGLFTAYMILMWTVDQKDCDYQHSVVRLKHRELSS